MNEHITKRSFYLATSVIILATVLGLAQVANVMQERRNDLVRELEVEKERASQLERRNAELEKTLQNRTTAPTRGGRTGSLMDMPITQPSGLTADAFEQALAGTGLAGLGEALIRAEAATGINSLVLAGIIAHESGWGSSALARDKNNLAGLGAYDDCPGMAIRFDSREECIFYLARLIADGGSLEEIGTWYASDPTWAEKVAGCMRVIGEKNHVY